LHLGHYVGSIANRVALQEKYRCFFIVADLHTLTTKYTLAEIGELPLFVREMVTDYLACGIDPALSTIYLQSAVPEVAEMTLLFSQLVTLPRLQRIPSLRDMAQNAGLSEMSLGLLTYPVLQTADILLARAQIVPVGKDNEAHLELTREIARRFNHIYERDFFPEPETLSGEVASLIGTDGKAKMSKSLSNAIFLKDEGTVLRKKVMGMFTDPARTSADVPGETENNPVFVYHRAFNSNKEEVAELTSLYQQGKIGDVEVKELLYKALSHFLAPIQERRREVLSQKGYVEEVIFDGTLLMREEARATLKEMKKLMGLSRIWNGISRKVEEIRKNK
jgi:tryptophanyl-tRNA synthetase